MGRLTERIEKWVDCKLGHGEECSPYELCECEHFHKMRNKLAEYEGLEEQGLLLKLPCKVGDTFFAIICDSVIYELRLNEIMKSKIVDKEYTYRCNVVGREWDVRYIESTNGLIYKSKSEAEKALEEMEK